jgi:hypothetical protein
MPEVECALGAYTGWNLRSETIGATGTLLANTGSYLPFELSKVQQRFPSQEQFLACVQTAADSLVARKLLLQRDIPKLVEAASKHWSWQTDIRAISSVQTR